MEFGGKLKIEVENDQELSDRAGELWILELGLGTWTLDFGRWTLAFRL